MIHTVYIDDSTIKGRKLLHILQKESDVVRFEEPSKAEIRKGYLTSSEFRTFVKGGLIEKLKADGSL